MSTASAIVAGDGLHASEVRAHTCILYQIRDIINPDSVSRDRSLGSAELLTVAYPRSDPASYAVEMDPASYAVAIQSLNSPD